MLENGRRASYEDIETIVARARQLRSRAIVAMIAGALRRARLLFASGASAAYEVGARGLNHDVG